MGIKKVTWSYKARQTFTSIYDFTRLKWGVDFSERFLVLVDNGIERIQKSNNIAPFLDNSHKFRRLVIHENISIIYQITESKIIVLLFWDNRQNPKELFEKLDSSR